MSKKQKKVRKGSLPAKRTDPRTTVSRMTVHVNRNGRVRVTPDNGNAFAIGQGNRPIAFDWELRAPTMQGSTFRLRFQAESYDGLPDPGTPWPFDTPGAGANGDCTPWGTRFTGDVRLAGAFKYTVEVRDEDESPLGELDPKIIIGRV